MPDSLYRALNKTLIIDNYEKKSVDDVHIFLP